jgi:hypothetical protein
MHSYNTRYQAKLQAKRLQEDMAWRSVNVPNRGWYAYRNVYLREVAAKIVEISHAPEGDMMKLMKYVDENAFVLVVDPVTRMTIRQCIQGYTKRVAEFGRHLIKRHESPETKKSPALQKEVVTELAEWVLLKNMMESLLSICKAFMCKV